MLTEPRSICVYTVLIGGYEKLNEQPVAASSSFPFICLTDDASLKSETWQLRQVAIPFAMDPVRSQRNLKIRCDRFLPEFDASLYIDNSVILKESPERVFERHFGSSGFSLPEHSFRGTLLDEFVQVARVGADDQARIFDQLNHYLVDYPDLLQEKPYAANVLLRDHRDPKVRAMLEIWIAHVLRYSRRDQLSANVAFHLAGLKPDVMRVDALDSWFHSWPHREGRDPGGARAMLFTQAPPSAGLRLIEAERKALRKRVKDLTAENKALRKSARELRVAMAKKTAELEASLKQTLEASLTQE